MHQSIPMAQPDLTGLELEAVNEVLQTPYLSIGPQLTQFETRFADYLGVEHAIGVNSGTSGLHLTVIAAGIGEDDLVITTPFSFVASANCVLYERAIPIFVDVEPITGNIDPVQVATAVETLTNGQQATKYRWLPPALRNDQSSAAIHRPKAILPVHAFGQPANIDPLLEIANQFNLTVIEDACEAIGAEYKGRKAGTLGDAAVIAFYPNKQMTTGEGGMIVTNNGDWANLYRSLRNQGRDVFNVWLQHVRLGYNYRLDEMSAALGLAQLQRIEDILAKRAQVAEWYNERLEAVELVELPYTAPTTSRMSWFVYVVRIKTPANRDEVMKELSDRDIPSRPYFTPIHLQPFYREKFGYQRGDFPVTEYLGDVSLALPFSSVMTEHQVDQVCAALITVLPCGK